MGGRQAPATSARLRAYRQDRSSLLAARRWADECDGVPAARCVLRRNVEALAPRRQLVAGDRR
jgi:hypothetical protein